MRLMHYAPIDWLNVVTMRLECATSNWVNVVLQDIVASHKPVFLTWAQCKEVIVQQFELVTEIEEARKKTWCIKSG